MQLFSYYRLRKLVTGPVYILDDGSGDCLPAEGNPDRDLWKINCWSLSEEVSGLYWYVVALI